MILKKSDRILDLGCGQGRHSVELARKGYNVTGVDFSERLICHAQNLAHAEKVKADISANPNELLELPPCNIMQKTGDIFDPKYFVLDEKSHLVYRKEQFEFDGELSAEYVIADCRFTAQELKDMFIGQGFNVLECRYVRAGHWDEPLSPTDKGAKEILIIIENRNGT